MTNKRRELLLKIVAISAVGLYLFDWIVIAPAIRGWTNQGKRIATLRENVERGRQLLGREKTIRGRWAEMLRTNLPVEVSLAENEAFKAVGRWARDSRVNLTGLTPQWQTHEDGYETLECRVAATGDLASLGRFVYEAETDLLPVNLEDCEFTTRDPRGAQISFAGRVTFLRMAATKGTAR